MITNVPSSESLNQIALRLYVSAWEAIVDIYEDFKEHYDPPEPWSPKWPAHAGQNWREYIDYCQADMQAVYVTIQQSNELALKARICGVSPYLLLLRSDTRFNQTIKDIDFGTFRTLDAVELPGAVNTLCKDTVSPQFIQSYERVRFLRNQISHLGRVGQTFQPFELLHILIYQYIELWPGRLWLKDRVDFKSNSRRGFFHDGTNLSAEAEVMHELSFVFGMLRPAEFKAIFGIHKKAKRYMCPVCFDHANVDYADVDNMCCDTAYLFSDKTQLNCLMCGGTYRVEMHNCSSKTCDSRITIRCDEPRRDHFCPCCGTLQSDPD